MSGDFDVVRVKHVMAIMSALNGQIDCCKVKDLMELVDLRFCGEWEDARKIVVQMAAREFLNRAVGRKVARSNRAAIAK